MNKKRIAQILTVLILLSNVNFQPNLIYADEVGNENVVSGSNLEEEEETGKEIELGTIDLDYYPNKYSQYSKRNYLSEAEKTVIKFGKEKLNKDFYISDALFENNKVCYKLIIKNALDDYFPYGNESNNNTDYETYKNGFSTFGDFEKTKENNYLIVFVNESTFPEPACPPSMTDELGTPVIECKISNSSGCCGCGNPNKPIVPVDPNDYPNVPNIPDPPTPSEDVPKPENPVTPSDLPKPKPNNPTTPTPKTPNTIVPKEPNTIVPKEPNNTVPKESTPITIITNKTNENVTNKNNPTTLSETKPVTRNIKTGDNLFFMLSLFSGMLSLFSFISIILNKRKII